MGDNNFRNTWAMRLIFFSKCLKFNALWKNAIENAENDFSFPDNYIGTGSALLSILLRDYS